MKRLAVLFLLIWFVIGFGQTRSDMEQHINKALESRSTEKWYEFERGVCLSSVTADSINITVHDGDSICTNAKFTMPWVYTEAFVDATPTADSTKFTVELWQSTSSDTSSFFFVKILQWSSQDGTVASADTINAQGKWICDWTEPPPYYGVDYYFLVIRGHSGNFVHADSCLVNFQNQSNFND